MSISRRALVFVSEKGVSIITLNTAQLIEYRGHNGLFTDAVSVTGSLSCGKMIIETADLLLISPLIASKRIDYLNYRHQRVTLWESIQFLNEKLLAVTLKNESILVFKKTGQFVKKSERWRKIISQSNVKQGKIFNYAETKDSRELVSIDEDGNTTYYGGDGGTLELKEHPFDLKD